jgi:signal transduction histidine kinase
MVTAMTPSESATLLVVDDTAPNLRLLVDMLREQGHAAVGVRSGERALAVVDANRPDLILLDINMPQMDGYEVCRRLKASEDTHDIPVVFLSALGEPMDKVKAFEVGGVDYITKPFQVEEVMARVRNHLTLSRLQERLRQADLAKSAFLANMSHEIRTPMNAILGYADVLAHHPDLDPGLMSAVETIRSSGDHLLELINDILDLSKIEAGHQELHETTIHLVEFLDKLGGMFRLRCLQQSLEWDAQIDVVDAVVRADEGKMRQVLINLLSNAVKFTEQGSVRLIVAQDGDTYRFEVTDTGPGIDAQDQAHVLDAFHQGEAGARKGGTGLGLPIARRHVEMMGGQLEFESTPGQGTSFRFGLQLAPTTEPVAEAQRYDDVIGLKPGIEVSALVVDDVSTNLRIMADLLTPLGITVEEAPDGPTALEAAAQRRVDFVLTDIRMPGMDGFELCRHLREAYGEDLTIVAVSASVLDNERRRCLDEGFDAFLPKPFRRQDLLACLAKRLSIEYERSARSVDHEAGGADGGDSDEAIDVQLPPELFEQLREAVRTRNITALERLIEDMAQIDGGSKALSRRLQRLCADYDLAGIGSLLEEIKC